LLFAHDFFTFYFLHGAHDFFTIFFFLILFFGASNHNEVGCSLFADADGMQVPLKKMYCFLHDKKRKERIFFGGCSMQVKLILITLVRYFVSILRKLTCVSRAEIQMTEGRNPNDRA
jgi:hypothetical protein